jgi:peptide chain release factor 2
MYLQSAVSRPIARRHLSLLKAKLYAKQKEKEEAEAKGRSVAATTANEWGSQMRSYVLHPYKMVKDHETGHESHDPEAVLAGDIDDFIDAHAAKKRRRR